MNDTSHYREEQPRNWKSKISLWVNAILCFFFFNVRLMFNGSYLGTVVSDVCWFAMCGIAVADVIARARHKRFKAQTGLALGILAICVLLALTALMLWQDRADWLTLFHNLPLWLKT